MSLLKGIGYFKSAISVVLDGIVAWKSVLQEAFLLACLIAGMLSLMLGMLVRWLSQQGAKARSRRPSPR